MLLVSQLISVLMHEITKSGESLLGRAIGVRGCPPNVPPGFTSLTSRIISESFGKAGAQITPPKTIRKQINNLFMLIIIKNETYLNLPLRAPQI